MTSGFIRSHLFLTFFTIITHFWHFFQFNNGYFKFVFLLNLFILTRVNQKWIIYTVSVLYIRYTHTYIILFADIDLHFYFLLIVTKIPTKSIFFVGSLFMYSGAYWNTIYQYFELYKCRIFEFRFCWRERTKNIHFTRWMIYSMCVHIYVHTYIGSYLSIQVNAKFSSFWYSIIRWYFVSTRIIRRI